MAMALGRMGGQCTFANVSLCNTLMKQNSDMHMRLLSSMQRYMGASGVLFARILLSSLKLLRTSATGMRLWTCVDAMVLYLCHSYRLLTVTTV